MEQQILQADRKYRQMVLLALLLCVFFGAALLQWGWSWRGCWPSWLWWAECGCPG